MECSDNSVAVSSIPMLEMYLLSLILLQATGILSQDDNISRLVDLINDANCQASSYQARTNDSDLVGSSTEDATADYGEFDFIVVGSGASGAAVASRLTENGNWTVLLLEAGGPTYDLSFIPFYSGLITLSDTNWGFVTTPQNNACLGRINNQCPMNRGKILGGTTSIFNTWCRGSQQDYNKWEAGGNSGWAYEDLLPYMKRVENFTINNNMKYHGFEGPISISFPKPASSTLNDKLFSGFENIGITRNKDYNGARLAGVSTPQYALRNGNQSTAIDYILQAQGRSNFNLTLNAYVTKVLISPTNKSAYGVTFVKNNVTYRATVRKEVLLSAGSFNTPKLLMLSGVGPRTELKNNGIEIIKSLPVGLSLKVQPIVSFFFQSDYIEPSRNLRDLVKEYLDGEGLLTIENNQGPVVFFRGNGSLKGDPNLRLVLLNPTAIPAPPFFANFKTDFGESLSSPNFANTFSTSVYLNDAFSNGNVTLKSNNVIDFPNINPNLFGDSRDIETMYEGVQVALRFAAAMNKFGVKLTPVFPPTDCNSYNNTTRQYWYCVIRQITTPYIYGAATVKMGPPSDPYSVVNNALQVYGIAGLRVVDYAVVPVNTNSCGNSIGYVIGEKAADILKKTYGYHNRYK